eukprot:scaffold110501_cov33-Phaeocystis_antarctica.AAC.1
MRRLWRPPGPTKRESEEVPPANGKKARASKEEAAKLKLSKAQARLAASIKQTCTEGPGHQQPRKT